MATKSISKENFQQEVIDSEMPVLIDFWAPWCGPCRMVSPLVEELSDELEGRLKVVKVNTDDEPELAAEYNVMSIPTLAVIRAGKVSASAVGARSKDEIKKLLGL